MYSSLQDVEAELEALSEPPSEPGASAAPAVAAEGRTAANVAGVRAGGEAAVRLRCEVLAGRQAKLQARVRRTEAG